MKVIDKVIEHFGTAYKLAKALDVPTQQVYFWKQKGFIPFKRGKEIERITNGAVKSIEIWEEAGRLGK